MASRYTPLYFTPRADCPSVRHVLRGFESIGSAPDTVHARGPEVTSVRGPDQDAPAGRAMDPIRKGTCGRVERSFFVGCRAVGRQCLKLSCHRCAFFEPATRDPKLRISRNPTDPGPRLVETKQMVQFASRDSHVGSDFGSPKLRQHMLDPTSYTQHATRYMLHATRCYMARGQYEKTGCSFYYLRGSIGEVLENQWKIPNTGAAHNMKRQDAASTTFGDQLERSWKISGKYPTPERPTI